MINREALARDSKSVLRIRDNITHTRVVVIVDHYVEESALIAILEGVRGLYLRISGPSKIVSCVRALARGEVWMKTPIIGRVIEEF
ncbi:MAG: hypothetical protein ABSB79_07565 [Syntrophales bacterium]|jgi:DNA-binding NarL/FixJ family response regulator